MFEGPRALVFNLAPLRPSCESCALGAKRLAGGVNAFAAGHKWDGVFAMRGAVVFCLCPFVGPSIAANGLHLVTSDQVATKRSARAQRSSWAVPFRVIERRCEFYSPVHNTKCTDGCAVKPGLKAH